MIRKEGETYYPISFDWVGFSLSLREMPKDAPKGTKWNKMTATNVWSQRWVLYNEHGQRLFTLLFDPRSSILRRNAALLEVDNEWLYHGLGIDGCLRLMSHVARYDIDGLSRADLAIDFSPTPAQVDVILGLADGRYYVSGKRNGSGFWSSEKSDWCPDMWKGIKLPHCQSWGHKTSDVKWKLYYKTKELKDAVGGLGWDKPYIVDMWRQFGLEESNVWRLEVSVKHGNNHLVCGDKMTWPLLRNNVSGVFEALYRERFQVCKNEGHKDRTNDTRIDFIPMESFYQSFRNKRTVSLSKRNGRITLLRHLVQSCDTAEVLLDDDAREMVFGHIEHILQRDAMGKYFSAMVGKDFYEWIEDKRVEACDMGEQRPLEDKIESYKTDPAKVPNTDFDLGTYTPQSDMPYMQLVTAPMKENKSRMKKSKYKIDDNDTLFD